MKFRNLFLLSFLLMSGCSSQDDNNFTIVTSNYASYDFVRAITKGSDVEIKLLLPPGVDSHSFEPTPKDIVNIITADLFIYNGGESEDYIYSIIKNNNVDENKTLKMMDLISLEYEQTSEGMENEGDEEEYDEHIWTSLDNSVQLINAIKDKIISLDANNTSLYQSNALSYINQIKEYDNSFKSMISSAQRKQIIVGDRFPFTYFIKEYNLEFYAAFKGCSESIEADSKTISFLINQAKTLQIPVIFKIELSSGNIANTIANECNAVVKEFNSFHNVSLEQFNNNFTYLDCLNNNFNNLREALN